MFNLYITSDRALNKVHEVYFEVESDDDFCQNSSPTTSDDSNCD